MPMTPARRCCSSRRPLSCWRQAGGFHFENVGVVGLGAGTISCYLAPAKQVTFYEIDPVTERIASDPRYFSYLADCGAHPDIVLGDGRQSLRQVPDGTFDLLIL